VQDFFVARDDRSLFARRCRHAAQQHLSVREPDHIGLTVEPRIVRERPGDRNEFLSVANWAGYLSRSLADIAFHPAGATADLALADVRGLAILHYDDVSDVVLIPGHRATARRRESDPQIARIMPGHVHVCPHAARQFETGSRTIHLAVFATGHATRHRAFPFAREADLLIGARAGHLRRRRGIGGSRRPDFWGHQVCFPQPANSSAPRNRRAPGKIRNASEVERRCPCAEIMAAMLACKDERGR